MSADPKSARVGNRCGCIRVSDRPGGKKCDVCHPGGGHGAEAVSWRATPKALSGARYGLNSVFLPDFDRIMQPAGPTLASTSPAATPLPDVPSHLSMGREFIQRHQIVERYLGGRLPPKGVQDFERFCADNPSLLDELGLPTHVNAALRLLEAGGRAPPWEERQRKFWEKPHALIARGGARAAPGRDGAVPAVAPAGGGTAHRRPDATGREPADRPGHVDTQHHADTKPHRPVAARCRGPGRRRGTDRRPQDRHELVGVHGLSRHDRPHRPGPRRGAAQRAARFQRRRCTSRSTRRRWARAATSSRSRGSTGATRPRRRRGSRSASDAERPRATGRFSAAGGGRPGEHRARRDPATAGDQQHRARDAGTPQQRIEVVAELELRASRKPPIAAPLAASSPASSPSAENSAIRLRSSSPRRAPSTRRIAVS